MAGKGDGEGEGSILKLENQIAVLKYVLLFTNVLEWVSDYGFTVKKLTVSLRKNYFLQNGPR